MSVVAPFQCAYIVCYELQQPPDKYIPLFAELQKSVKWSHYLTNTWIVVRTETLVHLAPKLRPLIFNTDRLLIMPAKGPADGWMLPDAWAWINENVPREW